MDPDIQNTNEIERDLEIRQIQDSLSSARRTKPTLKISNYPYDSRVHLYPLSEDQQYSTSNMDDLIDSMARRHLAYRRLDVAIDHQRRSGSVRSSLIDRRNDDPMLTRLTPRSQLDRDYARTNQAGFHQMLRSRIEYYTRLQNDLDTTEADDIFRANSYAKLPPIVSASNSNRFPPEHLIELPSDIFLASRADAILSSSRSRKAPRRTFSKESHSNYLSARSGLELSEMENDLLHFQRQPSHQEKNSRDGDPAFFTEAVPNEQNDRSRDIRSLFPKVATGVLFLIVLRRRAAESRKRFRNPSPSAAIHKIRLQEIIVALHRVYLEPDGPIYNVLIQTINYPIPLSDGLNSSSKNFAQAIDAIGDALRNVVSRIVDFMPKDGVLGTGKSSAVSNLLQNGNPFPSNYFWDCEKEHLEFIENKVININRKRAVILLTGIFIFRALITTLLIKPVKYRLILGRLSQNQSANLKVLASIILYVARRAAGRKNQIIAMPHEWQLSLYSDEAMKPIVQNAEMKEILTNCQQSIRDWCEEYIRRIDENHGRPYRT